MFDKLFTTVEYYTQQKLILDDLQYIIYIYKLDEKNNLYCWFIVENNPYHPEIIFKSFVENDYRKINLIADEILNRFVADYCGYK